MAVSHKQIIIYTLDLSHCQKRTDLLGFASHGSLCASSRLKADRLPNSESDKQNKCEVFEGTSSFCIILSFLVIQTRPCFYFIFFSVRHWVTPSVKPLTTDVCDSLNLVVGQASVVMRPWRGRSGHQRGGGRACHSKSSNEMWSLFSWRPFLALLQTNHRCFTLRYSIYMYCRWKEMHKYDSAQWYRIGTDTMSYVLINTRNLSRGYAVKVLRRYAVKMLRGLMTD